MKTALNVVAIIFTPVIVTLLLRLIIGILNLITEDIMGLFHIHMDDIFDFADMWWFWLIVAILSLIAIVIELAWINENVTD